MEIPPTGSMKQAYFCPPTDLIFAVIADVIHAHEDGQKLPVRLEVQTLERETAEGVGRCPGWCREQLGGVSVYLVTSECVYQMSGLAGEVAAIRSLEQSMHKKFPIPKAQTSHSQSVVSSHSEVESRLTDVSLHSMDGLPRSSSQEFGIEQLDDIWRVKGRDELLRVVQHSCQTWTLKSSYLPK